MRKIRLKNMSMIWFYIGIIVFGICMSQTFIKPNNICNILINASVFGVLALGQTLIMLVKEIDLSIGSAMAFAPTCAIFITNKLMPVIKGGNNITGGAVLIVVLTFAVGIGVSYLNSLLIVKLKIPSLIATLGVSYILQGLTYMFFNGYSLYLSQIDGFNMLGTITFGFVPLIFLILIAITVVLWVLMSKTSFGNRIYSVGGNQKAARYAGIHTGCWKSVAFLISGVFVALAALMYCSRMEAVETIQGSGYELTTIAIAVIGGTTLEGGRGKITSSFFAAILLSLILNVMSLCGLTSWYQTLLTGFIIIVFAIKHTVQYRKQDYSLG